MMVRVASDRPPPLHGVTPVVVPTSQAPPARERVLVYLDCDTLITIDGTYKVLYQNVEMNIAVPSTERAEAEEGDVQIVRATGEYKERARTPTRLGLVKEVSRVLDTPHGPDRFMGIPEALQFTSQAGLEIDFDKASMKDGLVGNGSGIKRKVADTDDEDNENSTWDEVDDLDNITRPIPANSTAAQSSPMVIRGARKDLKTKSKAASLSPSSSRQSPNTGAKRTSNNKTQSRHYTKDIEEAGLHPASREPSEEGDSNTDLPDSLPEAFHIKKSPLATVTYGTRGRRGSKDKKSTMLPSSIPETSAQSESGVPLSSALSPAPSSIIRSTIGGYDSLTFPSSGVLASKQLQSEMEEIAESSLDDAEISPTEDAMDIDESKHGDGKENRASSTETGGRSSTKETRGKKLAAQIYETVSTEELLAAIPARRPRLKRQKADPTPESAQFPEPIPIRKTKRKRGNTKDIDPMQVAKDVEEEACAQEDKLEEDLNGTMESTESRAAVKLTQKGKKALAKKDNKKPPKKRAKKDDTPPVVEKEKAIKKAEATQYTFRGSDDEGEPEDEYLPKSEVERRNLASVTESISSPPQTSKKTAKRTRKSTVSAAPATTKTPAKMAKEKQISSSPAKPSPPRTTKSYTGATQPKVVFSNSKLPDRKDLASILRGLGIRKAEKVTDKDVTHLVVGPGELVRSRYVPFCF